MLGAYTNTKIYTFVMVPRLSNDAIVQRSVGLYTIATRNGRIKHSQR